MEGEVLVTSSRDRRLNQIKRYYEKIRTILKRERSRDDFPWAQVDAGLVTGQHSLQEWFKSVLPDKRENIREYIQRSLSSNADRTALEIGGTGSKLFGEFDEGFFVRTAGVNLTDYRPDQIKQSDMVRNHEVIEGDAFDPAVQQDIAAWTLKGKGKIDLIFERMYGGSAILPKEPFFLSKQANFFYGLLSEGGLMFAEIPPGFEDYLHTWKSYVEKHYQGRLEVMTEKISVPNEKRKVSVLRLRKLKDAPDDFPLLDARLVLSRQRGNKS